MNGLGQQLGRGMLGGTGKKECAFKLHGEKGKEV